MPSAETAAMITADPEVQAAIERVLQGRRDPESMRLAAERMDKMREDMRKRTGNIDLAVPLIRETRDEG
jgi:C-terminal processing protease CtpA/Prc